MMFDFDPLNNEKHVILKKKRKNLNERIQISLDNEADKIKT